MNKEQVAAHLAATNPEAVMHRWLDEALIGYVHRLSAPPLALYDLDRCVEIARQNGWDWPGADEFMRHLLVKMWGGGRHAGVRSANTAAADSERSNVDDKSAMKISRVLDIHQCNACDAKLQDYDFERCGISMRMKLQLFFDYVCPKCNHRGRYTIDVDSAIKSVAAIGHLTEFLDDSDENEDTKIDWDALTGGN